MWRRLLIASLLTAVGLVPGLASGATTPGSLDGSFGGDGKATVDFGTYGKQGAGDVAVRGDGKVLLAGVLAGTTQLWAVARLRANGAPDPTFSGNGRAVTAIGSDDSANAILIRSNGRMLVGGMSDGAFALVAYKANGALDDSWGEDGIVTTPIPAGDGEIQHLRRLDGGAIFAAGRAGSRAVVVRYLSDGTPDESYGDAGLVTGPEFAGQLLKVRVEPDGAILATGASLFNEDSVTGVRAERYDAAGEPLESFGEAGGATMFYPGAEAGRGRAIVRQPDGKTLVAGSVFGEGDYRYHVVVRFLEDGTLDPTFGPTTDSIDGVIRGLHGCCYAQFNDLELSSDGKITVAGYNEGDSPQGILVGRYKPSGKPDLTFGVQQGFRVFSLGTSSQANALTIADGRIVVAGRKGLTPSSSAFAVARLHK